MNALEGEIIRFYLVQGYLQQVFAKTNKNAQPITFAPMKLCDTKLKRKKKRFLNKAKRRKEITKKKKKRKKIRFSK